jgi:hypothetical protein
LLPVARLLGSVQRRLCGCAFANLACSISPFIFPCGIHTCRQAQENLLDQPPHKAAYSPTERRKTCSISPVIRLHVAAAGAGAAGAAPAAAAVAAASSNLFCFAAYFAS